MKKLFQKIIIFSSIALLSIITFFVFAIDNNSSQIPDAKTYAPNFHFDSEEKYFPVDPLEFYYDKDLNEIPGKEARAKYDNLSLQDKLNTFKVFYKITESQNELIYQYWLFYVFNEFVINEHYGDWESVFVYVDKNTKKLIEL
jgi:hypothetical protein